METPLTGQPGPAIQTVWVMVAAILVMFMQVGFMFLEIGFSRMKNVGTIVPKILANFSIAALCYWAVGFALAFGGAGWFAGTGCPLRGVSMPLMLDSGRGRVFRPLYRIGRRALVRRAS